MSNNRWSVSRYVALGVLHVACNGGAAATDSDATTTGVSTMAATTDAAETETIPTGTDTSNVPGTDTGNTATGTSGGALDGETVTFIHYNDLHANLVPHRDMVRDPKAPGGFRVETRGGAARIASVIASIRAENPVAVAMNVGDTYHGGVEALFTDGDAVQDVITGIGFDLGVPGNWDFAFGPHVSWMRYRGEAATPMLLASQASAIRPVGFEQLAANVTVEADSTGTLPGLLAKQFSDSLAADDEKPWLPPTTTRMLGGVRVGFIGLTSDIVPRMHPMMALGLEFLDGEAAHLSVVEKHAQGLRADGCAIVVVMSELGIQKDYRLAQVVAPGLVDVFFSAHTHELTDEPLVAASGAIVVESGNDGWVGQLDVTLDAQGAIVERTWKLHPVDANVAEDPKVAALVATARAPFVGDDVNIVIEESLLPNPLAGQALTRSIETVIGETDRLLYRRNALESGFNNLFADMLLAYTGAEAAITPGFRFEVPLTPPGWDIGEGLVSEGKVTLEDAYRFFPAPYTLALGTTSVDTMRAIYESILTYVFSPTPWAQEGGWVDGFAGFEVTADLSRPDGDRVTKIVGPAAKQGPDLVLVAGCRRPFDDDDVMCSYPGFTAVTDVLDGNDEPMSPVALFEWGLQQAALPPPRLSLHDANATPMWPTAPFVQPLVGVE